MLRVLHVGKYYPPVPGGMERVVQTLCSVASDRLDSRVLAFSRGTSTIEEIVDGVPVTRVATLGQAGSVPVAPTCAAHLRRANADVMIVHEPTPWALLSLYFARPRMPFAVWFHSDSSSMAAVPPVLSRSRGLCTIERRGSSSRRRSLLRRRRC